MATHTNPPAISYHAALIYLMIMVSASDRKMTDSEMGQIGSVVKRLPVFRDFPADRLPETAQECAVLVNAKDGMEKTLQLIAEALPHYLRETGYAVACEVAAADGRANFEELRMLQLVRQHLGVDRLVAAAIERATTARFIRP
jgi:tellurite resistance protein